MKFNQILKALAFGLLLICSSANAVCKGRLFLPTDLDASFFGPVRVGPSPALPIGVSPAMLPPQQYAVPPFMICPLFRPCIVVQMGGLPRELIETTGDAGCSTTLGVDLLPTPYGLLNGEEQGDEKQNGSSVRKIHTHVFKIDPLIPLGVLPSGGAGGLGALDLITAAGCRQVESFSLTSMSEIDPIVNNDAWSALRDPTKLIFSTLPASLCSIPDLISSEATSYGLDLCYACIGDKGCRGMDSDNMSIADSPFKAQLNAAAVQTSRQYADLVEFQTTGPSAVCFSHPNPIVVKSESRYQNCGVGMPACSHGRPQDASGLQMLQSPPPDSSRPPGFEGGYFIKWKGLNCCFGFGLG